jgi:2-dehydro-3-deoxygluconokinase
MMGRVIAFGECMVELSFTGPSAAAIGYAGDTFNTAIYLRRLGLQVAYATALGEGDRFSRGILGRMGDTGIDTDLVTLVPGRLPGLYAIERNAAGERSFDYWRGEAPIRDFFRLADLDKLARAFAEAELIYLSGISLAVIGREGRGRLSAMLAEARGQGAAIAFDPNFRARLWPSTGEARAAVDEVAPLCRFISFSTADVEALFPAGAQETVRAWADLGIEVVARDEDRRITVHAHGSAMAFAPRPAGPVVDTTGAGDSFNAAYLAARLAGEAIGKAVTDAQVLAGRVVGCIGAIIPDGTASPDVGA